MIQNNQGLPPIPTLSQVQLYVPKLFGTGPYSTFPTTLNALAGTWMIQSTFPYADNVYVTVTPYTNSNNVSNVDLIVTRMQSTVPVGYLSLQSGNYLIGTPVPASLYPDPTTLPVTSAGLARSNDSINMLNFDKNNQSLWTRVANVGFNNVAVRNGLILNNGNVSNSALGQSNPTNVLNSPFSPQTLQNQQAFTSNVQNSQYLNPNTVFNSSMFGLTSGLSSAANTIANQNTNTNLLNSTANARAVYLNHRRCKGRCRCPHCSK